ncbi:diacylglycerol/lipid kinase family protein [Phenylobacterium immobile]|uniref:diacylglycerol/lipid kinase family protein n=1 Tax=Phenylobacterium immobile TaxID=21 RepID=UPI000A64E5A5|nr:diacylglycerol kinase family protein [Phenylobacterium immobile]
MRIGVIRNPQAHGNRGKTAETPPDLLYGEPTPAELRGELERFQRGQVDLLVIDGGDGTVRDVLSVLPEGFRPLISVLPSGKTNILAFDLGIRASWTLAAVKAAAAREGHRIRHRTALTVHRGAEPALTGFFFGVAGLVHAMDLAHGLHRVKVVNNTSVGLTLLGSLAEFFFGGKDTVWRRGFPLRLGVDGAAPTEGRRLITIATTLHRFPFAMRPFGPARPGLKLLDVDAPPKSLGRALLKVLWGGGDSWLRRHGYRRGEARALRFSLDSSFMMDGEIYPGGEIEVREGERLRFLTP